mmetsp:Transcript_20671/g.20603  ORF Transcript_20671/g.20603 Transcript_20671/m.20603 type:complete len:87 (-) Transcript_20671:44-304(-)
MSPGADPVSLIYKQKQEKGHPGIRMSPAMMRDGIKPETLSPQMKMFGFRQLPQGYRDGVTMWNQIYFQSNQENITGTPSPSIFLSM